MSEIDDAMRKQYANWTDEEYAAMQEENKMYDLEAEIVFSRFATEVIAMAEDYAKANHPARVSGILGSLNGYLRDVVRDMERDDLKKLDEKDEI